MNDSSVFRRWLLGVLSLLVLSTVTLGAIVASPAQAGSLDMSRDAQAPLAPGQPPVPGGIFITGHDPDFHSVAPTGNQQGAQHLLQQSVRFVTFDKPNPKLLLVTDLRNPGADQEDPRLGLQAAGFTFDTADYGSGQAGVRDLRYTDFRNYDAIVVASDVGGWLRQDELNVLIARATEVMSYVNNGGGLIVLNESGSRAPWPGVYPGTDHARYAFVSPSIVSVSSNQWESGFTVTPFGQAMGFTDADVNGNYSHSFFDHYVGLNVVDVDQSGRPISLGVRGQVVLYSIAGRITYGTQPVPGLAVSVAAGGAATTDASGYYTVTNLLAGTYALTPLSQCYQFTPPTISITVPPTQSGQDFEATPPSGRTCAWLLGPQAGSIGSPVVFSAGVSITSTAPVTFLWRATDQIDVTHVASGTDVISYTWSSPGTKRIIVTATAPDGPATVEHLFTAYARVYLPFLWAKP